MRYKTALAAGAVEGVAADQIFGLHDFNTPLYGAFSLAHTARFWISPQVSHTKHMSFSWHATRADVLALQPY
jgi:hypothetical protein